MRSARGEYPLTLRAAYRSSRTIFVTSTLSLLVRSRSRLLCTVSPLLDCLSKRQILTMLADADVGHLFLGRQQARFTYSHSAHAPGPRTNSSQTRNWENTTTTRLRTLPTRSKKRSSTIGAQHSNSLSKATDYISCNNGTAPVCTMYLHHTEALAQIAVSVCICVAGQVARDCTMLIRESAGKILKKVSRSNWACTLLHRWGAARQRRRGPGPVLRTRRTAGTPRCTLLHLEHDGGGSVLCGHRLVEGCPVEIQHEPRHHRD